MFRKINYAPGHRRSALSCLLLLMLSLNVLPARADDSVRGYAQMGTGVRANEEMGRRAVPSVDTRHLDGVDVSSHQGSVAWPTLWNSGVRWAYTKATEGTYYRNPYFTQQYNGSYSAGMIRGAYHFATPDTTNGVVQADYFVDHGGGWSKDGRTLPGTLDIEWNPYGDACYGKTPNAMVNWISNFLDQYKFRTGRDAVIYTSTAWWSRCTENHGGFAATNPLWLASYAASPGPLPADWSAYTMWQYTSVGPYVGDHSDFNGSRERLRSLADGL
ncbi:lysozyme [Streptomyces sp. NPDC055085]